MPALSSARSVFDTAGQWDTLASLHMHNSAGNRALCVTQSLFVAPPRALACDDFREQAQRLQAGDGEAERIIRNRQGEQRGHAEHEIAGIAAKDPLGAAAYEREAAQNGKHVGDLPGG